MKENISLKEIAGICKVSVSTVSKAMNDRNDISAEKKEEIRRVAREMHYVPNYMASVLKSKRTGTIGVLLAGKTGGLTDEHFARIPNSFRETVEDRGYIVTFLNSGSSPERHSLSEQCRYMKFDGVFVAYADYAMQEVQELLASDVPIVTIDHAVSGHLNVASDHYGDMKRMLQFVFDRGHRKIACIHGGAGDVTRGRLEAYRSFMKEHLLPVCGAYVYTCPYRDCERAAALTRAVLALPDRPTCILYPDDLTAVGGMRVMREAGLHIPDDLSVVGYDGVSAAGMVTPRLTTLRQDTVSMGIQAGNRLIGRIESPDAEDRQGTVVIPGMVEAGESVGIVRG